MFVFIAGIVVGYIFKDAIAKQLVKAIRFIQDKRDNRY